MKNQTVLPIQRRRILVFFILAAALITAATVPIEQSVQGPCRVEAASVWYLARGGSGQLESGWIRNLLDFTDGQYLVQFDRPDVVEIQFAEGLTDGSTVHKGDTLATIASREGESRLDVLQADLIRARAQADALLSGARNEDLRVAEEERRRAEAALETARLELERVSALLDSGFATQAEYEQALGEYNVLKAEVDVARATVIAQSSGARREDVAVALAKVEGLERAVEGALRLMGQNEVILSPADGQVRFGTDGTTLLRVESTDKMAVYAWISEAAVPLMEQNQMMNIVLESEVDEIRHCPVYRTEFNRDSLPGAYILGLLNNTDGRLSPGMSGRANVPIGKRTLMEGFRIRF